MSFIKRIVAVAIVLTMAICYTVTGVSALTIPGGDFDYEINTSSGEAIIVEYVGKATVVEIPSNFSGYTVTGIAESAFANNNTIQRITFPDTITIISSYAFRGCTALQEISIPETVTSLGTSVFNGCTSLTSAEINASITTIPQNTFYDCTALETVNLDSSIIAIGNAAFYNCKKLSGVPTASIIGYGQRSFYNTGLKSLTVSERADSVPSYAFSGCEQLEKVIFMGKDTTIAETAFTNSNSDLVIYCKSESTALQYALDHIYEYVLMDSVLGDANNDGYISISDTSAIQKHCAKIANMTDLGLIYGDVNGDGEITVRDATYIQLYLAKLIEQL